MLRNAVRFGARETSVDVMLDSADGKAARSLRDYGPGAPEEMRPGSFSPTAISLRVLVVHAARPIEEAFG